MLDVANNKENPTIGELIDRPKEQILDHINKTIGKNEGNFVEKVFDEINPFYPPSDKYIRNKLRAKIRKELGIKEGE